MGRITRKWTAWQRCIHFFRTGSLPVKRCVRKDRDILIMHDRAFGVSGNKGICLAFINDMKVCDQDFSAVQKRFPIALIRADILSRLRTPAALYLPRFGKEGVKDKDIQACMVLSTGCQGSVSSILDRRYFYRSTFNTSTEVPTKAA